MEVIGCNLFDLVHPLDHRDLHDVTSTKCSLNAVSRSSTDSNHHRLFIRMRCHTTTKGQLIAARSSAYQVCAVIFSMNFTKCGQLLLPPCGCEGVE